MNINQYWLPDDLRLQTIGFMRGYARRELQYREAIARTKEQENGHGSGHGDPTAQEALLRVKLRADNDIIDAALETLPAEYRIGVWNKFYNATPYPDYASHATWKRYKRKFIYKVCEKKGWLDEIL